MAYAAIGEATLNVAAAETTEGTGRKPPAAGGRHLL